MREAPGLSYLKTLEYAGHCGALLQPSYVHLRYNGIVYCEGRICCPFDRFLEGLLVPGQIRI